MRTVELLGPSGTGKSFLYQKLAARGTAKLPYLFLKEANIKAALRLPVSGRHQFLQGFLRQNLLNWKKMGIATTLLSGMKAERQLYSKDAAHVSFRMMMTKLQEESSPYVVHKRIGQFLGRLDQLEVLKKYTDTTDVLLLDEGPLHYHHGLKPVDKNTYSMEQISLDPLLKPLGIIYCELPAEEVYQRALKRKKSGVLTYSHGHLNDAELKAYIFKNVNENLDKRSFFLQTGVPVCTIQMQDDLEANLRKVDQFILNQMQQQNLSQITNQI